MGNRGVSGQGNEPSVFDRLLIKGVKLLSSISTQSTQVGNNENLLNKQTWQGYPVSHPA